MPEFYTLKLNCQNPLVVSIIKDLEEKTSKEAEKFNKEKETVDQALKELDEATKDKKYDEITTEQRESRTSLNKQLDEIREKRKGVMTEFGKGNTLLKQVADLALLSNGMLKGKALSEFISRSLSLLEK